MGATMGSEVVTTVTSGTAGDESNAVLEPAGRVALIEAIVGRHPAGCRPRRRRCCVRGPALSRRRCSRWRREPLPCNVESVEDLWMFSPDVDQRDPVPSSSSHGTLDQRQIGGDRLVGSISMYRFSLLVDVGINGRLACRRETGELPGPRDVLIGNEVPHLQPSEGQRYMPRPGALPNAKGQADR